MIVDTLQNQAPFVYIDIPGPCGLEGANGSFPVAGWAVDDVEIASIDFLVDGRVIAGAVGRGEPSTATYVTTRPDVAAAFPDVPLALYSGFIANIDTSQFINGIHNISVRATDTDGATWAWPGRLPEAHHHRKRRHRARRSVECGRRFACVVCLLASSSPSA